MTHGSIHPDTLAVKRFSEVMQERMSRSIYRENWDSDVCSDDVLARDLLDYLSSGNPGNFVDIANCCMMLHQRGADPSILVDVEQPGMDAVEDRDKNFVYRFFDNSMKKLGTFVTEGSIRNRDEAIAIGYGEMSLDTDVHRIEEIHGAKVLAVCDLPDSEGFQCSPVWVEDPELDGDGISSIEETGAAPEF